MTNIEGGWETADRGPPVEDHGLVVVRDQDSASELRFEVEAREGSPRAATYGMLASAEIPISVFGGRSEVGLAGQLAEREGFEPSVEFLCPTAV